MSFSLKIADGDLSTSSDHIDVVQGVDKLTQDLSLWLREQYGLDRFHPDYGSTLDTYVGDVINPLIEHNIEVEITRILSIYQQTQYAGLQSNPSKYSLDELLDTVVSVDITSDYDRVTARITFRTALGSTGVVGVVTS